MNFVVEFQLPQRVSREKAQYIAASSVGLWMIVGLDKKPKAIIKEYVIQKNSIIFRLDLLDDDLVESITTGDPDPRFIWLNPLESMFGDPH